MHKLSGAALAMAVTGCMVGDSVTIDDPGISFLERQATTSLPNNSPLPDPTGTFATVSTIGKIDLGNEFFQDLGSNGRRCVSCHVPAAAWTITPSQLRSVFDATSGGTRADTLGLGAIFRTNDGANSPTADVSTLDKRRAAYSMVLDRGLIRVGLAIP